jgi:beta-N-acetylhexosaminidase
VRRHHARVAELVVDPAPGPAEIAAARLWAADRDLLVVGTTDASFEPDQATLVRELLATGRPMVTLALRTPWDIASYASTGTHVCTYSIHQPSLDAAVDALWGLAPFQGRMPVAAVEVAA